MSSIFSMRTGPSVWWYNIKDPPPLGIQLWWVLLYLPRVSLTDLWNSMTTIQAAIKFDIDFLFSRNTFLLIMNYRSQYLPLLGMNHHGGTLFNFYYHSRAFKRTPSHTGHAALKQHWNARHWGRLDSSFREKSAARYLQRTFDFGTCLERRL